MARIPTKKERVKDETVAAIKAMEGEFDASLRPLGVSRVISNVIIPPTHKLIAIHMFKLARAIRSVYEVNQPGAGYVCSWPHLQHANLWKISATTSPTKRQGMMQVDNDGEIGDADTVIQCDDRFAVQRRVHTMLARYRSNGFGKDFFLIPPRKRGIPVPDYLNNVFIAALANAAAARRRRGGNGKNRNDDFDPDTKFY